MFSISFYIFHVYVIVWQQKLEFFAFSMIFMAGIIYKYDFRSFFFYLSCIPKMVKGNKNEKCNKSMFSGECTFTTKRQLTPNTDIYFLLFILFTNFSVYVLCCVCIYLDFYSPFILRSCRNTFQIFTVLLWMLLLFLFNARVCCVHRLLLLLFWVFFLNYLRFVKSRISCMREMFVNVVFVIFTVLVFLFI